MKKVELKCNTPIVKGYLFYAFPLTIMGYNEKTEPWILSNFIQTCFDKDFLDSPVPFAFYSFDFSLTPWLNIQKLKRKTIDDLNIDIISFLKSNLDNKCYVQVYLDEFYVPNRLSFRAKHFCHENLIAGYNDNTMTFDIMGFNEELSYKKTKITYEQIRSAYSSVRDLIRLERMQQELHSESYEFFNTIVVYQFNKHGHYLFDINTVLETLEDYIYGRNTSLRYSMIQDKWDRIYGIECYKYISKYLKELLRNNVGYDIRYLHNLWEHKMLNTRRVQYMLRNGYLDIPSILDQFSELEKLTLSFRNKMIKYALTKEKKEIQFIVEKLEWLEEEENKLIKKLITNVIR